MEKTWKTLDERQNGNVQPCFVGASWVVSLAKKTIDYPLVI